MTSSKITKANKDVITTYNKPKSSTDVCFGNSSVLFEQLTELVTGGAILYVSDKYLCSVSLWDAFKGEKYIKSHTINEC